MQLQQALINLYATPKCITLVINAEQIGITYLMSNDDICFEVRQKKMPQIESSAWGLK